MNNDFKKLKREMQFKDAFVKQFFKERNEAFIDAVVNDDFTKFKTYCKKYGVPLPPSKKIMKATVYKAVQECTDIPRDVKAIAFDKCIALGFEPYMFMG